MKRKLLSVLLTFCLAFSLLPTAAMAEEPANVAEVNGTKYATLQAAVNEANDGDTVTLLKDAELTETLDIDKAITLDGANHKITGSPSTGKTSFITVITDGSFTMANATILPTSKVEKNSAIDLQVKGKVVVDNCVFGAADDANQFMYNGLEFSQSRDYPMADGTTISNCTFYGGSFRHNFISFYRMAEGATININGNKFLNVNWDTTNAIRVSNYSNVNATINLLDDTYNDHGTDENKDYAGLLIFQETSDNNDKFTTLTVNIKNLDTTGAQSNQLFYVYKDSIISTNQPVVKGDSSIEKFFVAKVGDTYYKTLADAVAAAKNGGTIDLLSNVSERLWIRNNEDVTINLNGYTISSVNQTANVQHGKLTVNGPGTIKEDTPYFGALLIKGSTNQSDTNYAVATINKNVTLEGWAPVFIDQLDSENNAGKAYGITVNLNGAVLNGKKDSTGDLGSGIYVNGNIKDATNAPVINLDSTTVTSEGQGMYLAGYATTTVNGGSVSGSETGIEIRAGKLTVNGATVNGNGIPTSVTPNGNGSTSVGAGIAVAQHTTKLPIDVTISGGTISGYTAFYESNPQNNAAEDLAKINIAVKGGEFKAINGGTNAVYSQNKTGFISGGYFTSDPTAYLAAGKGLVTSDQNAFAYKVGDKATNVETAVTAGEAAVTIPEGVTGITEAAVKNAAKAADTTKTLTDTVAASGMTNDPAVVGTKEAAEAALSAKNISVGSGDTVTVVVQPYLEVNVKSADAGKLTLEISAKYNVVATTGSPVTIDPDKTATLKSGVPLSINKPIELTIVLPTGFAAVNSKIYVQHKGYEYTATVDASGTTATFINPHGFSTFTVTPTASAVAEVDGTSYTDLQKAVDAVSNNGTVKLLNDTSASAVVSRAVKFTLDKNSKSFTGAITAGSGYELSVDGNVYTFTVRSSSGSSGSSSDPTYSVSTPSKTENGSVTVSPKSASKGDTVTVTVKPDSGYVLETLTVTDKNGNELTLKDKGNGKYTFTMPAGKVEVKATFMEDNSMLNFFYDVPNNAYFYEAVKWAVKNGITTGVGNDLFAPEQPCTRAQIVTFLWRAAGSPEPKGAASGMTDVVSGSYYEKAVAWAIENGITTGTTTTTFSPDVTCTRAQAVTFLARALKAKAASAAEFSDVPTDSYFADAVAWAAANGVTEGIGGGLFGSDNDCTRGQIVTFLYRAYNK